LQCRDPAFSPSASPILSHVVVSLQHTFTPRPFLEHLPSKGESGAKDRGEKSGESDVRPILALRSTSAVGVITVATPNSNNATVLFDPAGLRGVLGYSANTGSGRSAKAVENDLLDAMVELRGSRAIHTGSWTDTPQ
jgi:hypothetical protein